MEHSFDPEKGLSFTLVLPISNSKKLNHRSCRVLIEFCVLNIYHHGFFANLISAYYTSGSFVDSNLCEKFVGTKVHLGDCGNRNQVSYTIQNFQIFQMFCQLSHLFAFLVINAGLNESKDLD